jgi:hypothetical protein
MTVYHQMGHDSENLIFEDHLSGYRGAFLSPVNYNEYKISNQISKGLKFGSEMIFDSQLYFPNSERGKLSEWSYFPSDVDTADHSMFSWWVSVINSLLEVNTRINANAICTPSIVPKVYSNEYYLLNRQVASEMHTLLAGTATEVIYTLLVKLEDLGQSTRSVEIASIISASDINRVYLVVISGVEPRREIVDVEELKGVMKLIDFLEKAGINVIVGFTSSDIILWKAAGASACATGKFFNLRRFTPSRWDPPAGGGGQLPYWFEESMVAFLRESDLIRISEAGYLSETSQRNPYSQIILDKVNSGSTWLGDSWRHYLYWFGDLENRLSSSQIEPRDLLRNAEDVWNILESKDILMEERPNDGSWLRPWRRAVAEAFR